MSSVTIHSKATIKAAKLAVLMTGTELMAGDVVDSNSATLAQMLSDIGMQITEKCTVGDDKQQLLAAIIRLSHSHDCLIINGGLGPTEDDLTSEVMAEASGQPVKEHHQARQHVLQWCKSRGYDTSAANLKQACLPASAQILPDAPGSAPAFYIEMNNCLVLATPGVPSELEHIMRHQALHLLQKTLPHQAAEKWKRFSLLSIGESRLQQLLIDSFSGLEHFLDIGFRAGLPTLEFKYRRKIVEEAELDTQRQHIAQLNTLIAPFLVAEGDGSIALQLMNVLKAQGKTLSTAESCTGGLIASEITKIPGSSAVFPGSIVSYSNAIKQRLLNVSEATLSSHGAVSQQTAEQMLLGVLAQTQADFGIAVTGIAGPDGGSDEKPVGMVWIAWGKVNAYRSVCLHIPFAREDFQKMVTAISLELLRRQLLGLDVQPLLARWKMQ